MIDRIRNAYTTLRLGYNVSRSSSNVTTNTPLNPIWSVANVLLLIFLSLFIFFPFYFMISTSLLSDNESLMLQSGEQIYWPSRAHFENYYIAATVSNDNQQYLGALSASLIITIVSVFARLFYTLSFGYAFSLPRWRGKRLSWCLFLLLLAVPESGILLGQFAIVQKTALKDSLVWVGLTIPFVASVFSGYLFRSVFERIPRQIWEAAAIDGTTHLGFLFRIAIPMIKSIILTVVIITIFGAWNSYIWPNMILNSEMYQWKPINMWVYNAGMMAGAEERRFLMSVRLAAAALAILPMFIIYFLFRNRIMRAIMQQGQTIKG